MKVRKSNDQVVKLKTLVDEEHVDNKNEAELTYGKPLTYGERIQLRHIHSNSFVTTSKEVSKERGCLKVMLDPNGNEGSWLEINSYNHIREDGKLVKGGLELQIM